MDHPTDIFSYIQTQENNYKQGIKLAGNLPWAMKVHLSIALSQNIRARGSLAALEVRPTTLTCEPVSDATN